MISQNLYLKVYNLSVQRKLLYSNYITFFSQSKLLITTFQELNINNSSKLKLNVFTICMTNWIPSKVFHQATVLFKNICLRWQLSQKRHFYQCIHVIREHCSRKNLFKISNDKQGSSIYKAAGYLVRFPNQGLLRYMGHLCTYHSSTIPCRL